jgi:hypothetical protein
VCLIVPEPITDALGLGLGMAALLLDRLERRRSHGPT